MCALKVRALLFGSVMGPLMFGNSHMPSGGLLGVQLAEAPWAFGAV